jgi:dephospho-CoA kinase
VAERTVRPFNAQEIRERDQTEIENLEKGGPIAAADYYILNDGTIDDLKNGLDNILGDIEF